MAQSSTQWTLRKLKHTFFKKNKQPRPHARLTDSACLTLEECTTVRESGGSESVSLL